MKLKRAYEILFQLYPADYKARFASEMLSAFEKTAEERRALGQVAHFAFSELIGLVRSAAMEWIAKWTTDRSARGRVLPDVRMMRPPGVPKSIWFADSGTGTTHLRD